MDHSGGVDGADAAVEGDASDAEDECEYEGGFEGAAVPGDSADGCGPGPAGAVEEEGFGADVFTGITLDGHC